MLYVVDDYLMVLLVKYYQDDPMIDFYLMLVVKRLDYQVQMNDYLLLMMEQDVDYELMLVYMMKYDLIAKIKQKFDLFVMNIKIYSW
jgi:hypothetical protein